MNFNNNNYHNDYNNDDDDNNLLFKLDEYPVFIPYILCLIYW